MSSDLSRTLTEAAWAEMAGPAWRNVTYADLSEADPDTVMRSAKERVDRTVAAVLETLAADEQGHRFGYPLHDLRRLAVEARAGEDG